MTRRERLDDGSMIEDLVVEVNGAEYHGTLTIRRVDRHKSVFEVDYGMHHHHDKSLFLHSSDDQMRLHARFVLKSMVEEDRKSKEGS